MQQTAALLLLEWAAWWSPWRLPGSQAPHRWAPLSLEAEWSWPLRTITVSSVMPPLVPRPWLRLTTKGRTTPRGCGWQKRRVTHSRNPQRLGHGGAGKKGMTIKWCQIGEICTQSRIIQAPTLIPAHDRGFHGIWPCVLLQAASFIVRCVMLELVKRWSSGSTWRASSIKARCLNSGTGTRWRIWATYRDSCVQSSVSCRLPSVNVSCSVVLWYEYIPTLTVSPCNHAVVLWDVRIGEGQRTCFLGSSNVFRLVMSSYLFIRACDLPTPWETTFLSWASLGRLVAWPRRALTI